MNAAIAGRGGGNLPVQGASGRTLPAPTWHLACSLVQRTRGPTLTRPIPPFMGVLWLAAALLFPLTAGALFVRPRWWWAIGLMAIAVSMVAIVPSWGDAKFGALANLVALAGVVFGFLADGPVSQRAAYERDVERLFAPTAGVDVLTDANLAPLPAPVQRYRAELSFNDAGELTNFWSDDRQRASPDGKTMTAIRWSTPIGNSCASGPVRLASRGEGRWHEPGGEYAYIRRLKTVTR